MKKKLCTFAIASCVPDGGIYKYELFDDGSTAKTEKLSLPSPMYLDVKGDKMTVLLRAPFDNSKDSGICVCNAATGELLSPVISTLGEVGCHIAVDKNDIYCANYVSGSIFKAPDKLVIHKGRGINPKRQESPHTHSMFFSPDKKSVISCDLGTDEVYIYDRTLNELARIKVPDGNGPRHICFSNEGKYIYCLNEMGASISVIDYENLAYIKDISIRPDGYTEEGQGAAIKPSSDGTRIYVSERGSNTIALLYANGENITVKAHFDCKGEHPRDISLIANEKFLICTNQFSDSVSVFKVLTDGALEFSSSFSVPAPLCVCEI